MLFGNANTITKETTYNEEDLEQMLEEYNSKYSVSEDEENDEYAMQDETEFEIER